MPKLRPLRTKEEIAAVPADKPVVIDVSDAIELEIEQPETKLAGQAVDPTTPEPAEPEHVEPEQEPEPDQNDLRKQLEAMTKAEGLAKREAAAAREREAAAVRHAQQRDQDLARERGGREQAQYDSVLNAIGAATAEAETAQRDLEAAMGASDFRVAAEAQRRLSTATARLVQLEDGKAAYDAQREEANNRPAPPPGDPVAATIDTMTHLSSRQRDWLRSHRDAVGNEQAGVAHYKALAAGHAVDSDSYFQSVEEQLGYRQPRQAAAEPQRRSPPVSAPVSRDTPNLTTGKTRPKEVTLSPEQREAARISGVDEVTYAKGVLELQRRKALGMYPDR